MQFSNLSNIGRERKSVLYFALAGISLARLDPDPRPMLLDIDV
jgi:hypothetical protein